VVSCDGGFEEKLLWKDAPCFLHDGARDMISAIDHRKDKTEKCGCIFLGLREMVDGFEQGGCGAQRSGFCLDGGDDEVGGAQRADRGVSETCGRIDDDDIV